ncbi:hypothetical protein [Aliiroseovarius sediminilitoris]|uniref:hypothetical protein n=1 Tax=Aliiroseovarius sediminilitoris TaxID=1173584 RepID=UPI00115FDB12|nr:hypothetical protein [Aliiroseovarius sediminilitoris]
MSITPSVAPLHPLTMDGCHAVPFCDRSKPSREALARFGMSRLDRIEPEHRSPTAFRDAVRTTNLNPGCLTRYYMVIIT